MSVKFTSLMAGKDCVGDWDKIIFLLTSVWFGNELLVPRFCQGLKNRAAELTCKQPLLLVPRCAWSRRTWVISLSFVLLIPPAQLLWMIHLKSRSGGQEDVGTGTEEQWAGLGKWGLGSELGLQLLMPGQPAGKESRWAAQERAGTGVSASSSHKVHRKLQGNHAYVCAFMAGSLYPFFFLILKWSSLPRDWDLNSLTWKAFCVTFPLLRPSQASTHRWSTFSRLVYQNEEQRAQKEKKK